MKLRFMVITLALTSCSIQSLAQDRIFTYTYQSAVLNPGQQEIEIWNTFHWGRTDFYRELNHRIEYEVGLASNLQTAFYLNVKSELAFESTSSPSLDSELEVSFSNEWKYKLSDPVADGIGSAMYVEVGISADEFELEGKLILDKTIGQTFHAFNAVAEPAWKTVVGGNTTRTEFALNFEFDYGFAYQLNDKWHVGVELRNLNLYTKETGVEYSALFGGPVISYSTERFWINFTILPQLVALKGATHDGLVLNKLERLETRLLFSYGL